MFFPAASEVKTRPPPPPVSEGSPESKEGGPLVFEVGQRLGNTKKKKLNIFRKRFSLIFIQNKKTFQAFIEEKKPNVSHLQRM